MTRSTFAEMVVQPQLRVALYKDPSDGEWVVFCLEMSIHGWGATWDEALNVLEERIEAHVNFAFEHDRPEAIFCPAGPEWQARWPCQANLGFPNIT